MSYQYSSQKKRASQSPTPLQSPSTPDNSGSYEDVPIPPPPYVPLTYYFPVVPDPSADVPTSSWAQRDAGGRLCGRHSRKRYYDNLPAYFKHHPTPPPNLVVPPSYISGFGAVQPYHTGGVSLSRELELVSARRINQVLAELAGRSSGPDQRTDDKGKKESTDTAGWRRMAFFIATIIMALFVGSLFSYYVMTIQFIDKDIKLNNTIVLHVNDGGAKKVLGTNLPGTTTNIPTTGSKLSFYLNPKREDSTESSETATKYRSRTMRCRTPFCYDRTALFKRALNWTIAPCDDFYEFVCASWKTSSFHSQDSLYVEAIENELRDGLVGKGPDESNRSAIAHAKELLDLCIRNTSSDSKAEWSELRALLDRVGLENWPYKNDTISRADLWRTNALLYRYLGLSALVSVTVEKDPENDTNFIIALDEPDLLIGLFGTRDTFLPNWYGAVVRATMKLFSPYKYLTHARNVLEFSEKLAGITSSRGERNYADEAKITTVHNVFSYAQFLGLIFDEITPVTERTRVLIKNARYLKSLKTLLHVTQNCDVLNYLGFRTVLHVSPLVHGEGFSELAAVRMKQLTGLRRREWPRWETCIRMMDEVLPTVYLQYYSKLVQKKMDTDRIAALLNDLKSSLLLDISDVTWLSQEDKIQAKNILSEVKLETFFPSWFNDKGNTDYSQVFPSQTNRTFLEAYRDHTQKIAEARLSTIAGVFPGQYLSWKGSIFDTYPTFDYESRTVFVPVGVFNFSYPNTDAGLLVQVPRMATRVMASLIGSLHRNFYPWPQELWLLNTTESLKSKKSCLQSQYQLVSNSMHDEKVRSSITTTYDFLDNAASEPALKQFVKYSKESGVVIQKEAVALPVTVEQLFHVLFAFEMCERGGAEQLRQELMEDAFTQPKLRVNVPLRNTESFAKAWQCGRSDAMNPSQKCKLWM